MSHKDFDKELASLYQQRKQQVQAPDIKLSPIETIKKPRYGLWQMLSILLMGGATSFGILAVISHFSVKEQVNPVSSAVSPLSVVELVDEPVNEADEVIIPILSPLTPKKPYLPPATPKPEKVLMVTKLPTALTLTFPVDVVNVAATPIVEQPNLSLIPLYQEQPIYSPRAIRAKQSGIVKLAYRISPTGEVNNIALIESTAPRDLNRSAKKALANWRYQAGTYEEEAYEIVFDFTLNEKK